MSSTIMPPRSIIELDRPRTPAGLLSKSYRDRLIERGFFGLYRWYVTRSQETRNWNPYFGFEWNKLRPDLSEDTRTILKGFFAVEQYVPDYTSKALHLLRRSHGRANFQIRWGSEEEKHAATWETAVMFSGAQNAEQLDSYRHQLRGKEWELPWEDPLHLITYTVFQERATQLNYLNMAKIATGDGEKHNDIDPVLAKVSATIAADEAAHYNFFLEGLRLIMYYYPLEALEAIRDVVTHFAMPAQQLMPDWEKFFETAYRTAVYGPRQYAKDVVAFVFKNLGIEGRKSLEDGIKRTREIPDEEGQMRTSAIWQTFDPSKISSSVERLHQRISEFEKGFGWDKFEPLNFTPNPVFPK
ncbi:MAG: acyl-ACP desaturase [Trueperaceae bacterium]